MLRPVRQGQGSLGPARRQPAVPVHLAGGGSCGAKATTAADWAGSAASSAAIDGQIRKAWQDAVYES
jgi:hypothetical protein